MRNVLGKALPKVENSVSRVEQFTLQGSKIFEKISKNPLTNGTECAIIRVSRGEGRRRRMLAIVSVARA